MITSSTFTLEFQKKLESLFLESPGLLSFDEESLVKASHDFTEDLRFMPLAVFRPTSADQISRLLRFANDHRIPVTTRGAGTGLSGAALPVQGGIVCSLEKMNHILEVDQNNLMCVTEPGVITQVLQEAVEAVGLYYPPDPSSRGSCFIGGNISHGAGGPRAVKYGTTKDYVCGLEAVLANGDIIQHGGKLLKNSTGYNLSQLMVASEGTLAIITKIYLRLIPLPKERALLLVPFDSLEEPAKAVSELFRAGLTPSACEYMEQSAFDVGCRSTSQSNSFPNAKALLLIELDGMTTDEIDAQLIRLHETLEPFHPTQIALADTDEKVQRFWRIRRAIGEAVKTRSIYKEEDTVVPRFELPHLLKEVKRICADFSIESVCYGHAGDGNLHVNLLKANMSDQDWNHKVPIAIRQIFTVVKQLGGTLSGEHGVGYVQKNYIDIVYSDAELSIMKAVKTAFDPKGILNPRKIFPDE